MRSWQVKGAFGLDHLELSESPPAELAPGEARLRLSVAALNYRDLMMIRGQYNPRQPLPFIPCSDAVGTITELGCPSREFSAGDRVCPNVAVHWLRGPVEHSTPGAMLGGPIPGTLAEELVVPIHSLVKLPPGINDSAAATLPCAAVTAYAALFEHHDFKPGDTVVTQGSGGVSLFALQMAKAAGARVIATTSREEKAARLRYLGADEVINYRETPNWSPLVKDLTGGRGADCIVEVGGAETLAQSLQAIRPAGTIAIIGVLSGAAGQVDLRPVLMRAVRLQGVLVGPRESLEAVVRFVAATELSPIIDRTFAFEDAPEALAYMNSGAHVGKVLVKLASE